MEGGKGGRKGGKEREGGKGGREGGKERRMMRVVRGEELTCTHVQAVPVAPLPRLSRLHGE